MRILVILAALLIPISANALTCKDVRKLSFSQLDMVVRQYQIPCETQLQVIRACRLKVPKGYCR